MAVTFTYGGTTAARALSGRGDTVGITDRLHIVVGRPIPDAGLGITDPGQMRDLEHVVNDSIGITERMTGAPVVTVGSAVAAGSLTLSATANAADGDAPTFVQTTVLQPYRAVRIAVSGLGGFPATVWRTTANQAYPTEVRLAVIVSSSESLVGVDYEAPMDVPLTYFAIVNGVTYTAAHLVIPSEGRDWYTALGQPSLSRPITVESFPELTKPLSHSRVRPLASRNPLIILHTRVGSSGTLTLLTMDYAEAQAVRYMLEVSPLFQFKAPADRDIPEGTMYLLAGDYKDARVVRNANEPTRRFVIDVVEVDRPPLVVAPPAENTWQDWADEPLSTSTWAVWATKSWLDVLIEEQVGS